MFSFPTVLWAVQLLVLFVFLFLLHNAMIGWSCLNNVFFSQGFVSCTAEKPREWRICVGSSNLCSTLPTLGYCHCFLGSFDFLNQISWKYQYHDEALFFMQHLDNVNGFCGFFNFFRTIFWKFCYTLSVLFANSFCTNSLPHLDNAIVFLALLTF